MLIDLYFKVFYFVDKNKSKSDKNDKNKGNDNKNGKSNSGTSSDKDKSKENAEKNDAQTDQELGVPADKRLLPFESKALVAEEDLKRLKKQSK